MAIVFTPCQRQWWSGTKGVMLTVQLVVLSVCGWMRWSWYEMNQPLNRNETANSVLGNKGLTQQVGLHLLQLHWSLVVQWSEPLTTVRRSWVSVPGSGPSCVELACSPSSFSPSAWFYLRTASSQRRAGLVYWQLWIFCRCGCVCTCLSLHVSATIKWSTLNLHLVPCPSPSDSWNWPSCDPESGISGGNK